MALRRAIAVPTPPARHATAGATAGAAARGAPPSNLWLLGIPSSCRGGSSPGASTFRVEGGRRHGTAHRAHRGSDERGCVRARPGEGAGGVPCARHRRHPPPGRVGGPRRGRRRGVPLATRTEPADGDEPRRGGPGRDRGLRARRGRPRRRGSRARAGRRLHRRARDGGGRAEGRPVGGPRLRRPRHRSQPAGRQRRGARLDGRGTPARRGGRRRRRSAGWARGARC